MEEGANTMDRISELPEDIIHHILSLLRCPKDVTRTATLSKKWRSLWTSFFYFNFDQRSFLGGQTCPSKKILMPLQQIESFKRFVDSALATRLEPMFSIQKFRLNLTYFDFTLTPCMSKWITKAIDKNVRDLEIHVEVKKNRGLILPQNVLSSQTITSLKLYGCKLDNLGDVKLSNLIELSIKKAQVNFNVIQSFIVGSPLIEDLRIINCSNLDYLHISTLTKLNRVEIHECHCLRSVEIQIKNLRSFWYYRKNSRCQCKLNLAGCENLKHFSLRDPYMTDEVFLDHISWFPALENLVLNECENLKEITIRSRKLKGLYLIRCKKLEKANINALNLSSFEYSGDKIPFSSMNISGLHDAKMYFNPIRKNNIQISREMQKFLGKFKKSNGFKLVIRSKKNVTVYEELKEIKLASFKDLKLEFTKSSANLIDVVDNLLRASNLKSLSIISPPSSSLLKAINDKITNRVENPSCCTYYSVKCWRHYLEDATKIVEVSGGGENEEASFPTLKTSFKLKWKPKDNMESHLISASYN